ISTGNICSGNMNQLCKVCGESAAGFHFGAFTCEGCKSFFGRTYNNLSSLNECKNNGRCVINKKTRTSCKSCRLRKCLMVGMSKSGSRYGRRSNWFKIHYLMNSSNHGPTSTTTSMGDSSPSDVTITSTSSTHHTTLPSGMLSPNSAPKLSDFKFSPEFKISHDFKILQEFKSSLEGKAINSPAPSSSESHNSDTSLDLSEKSLFSPFPDGIYPKDLLSMYNLPTMTPRLPPYVTPANLAQRYLYPYYPSLLSVYSRKQYLDSLLQEARQEDDMHQPTQALTEIDDDSDHNDGIPLTSVRHLFDSTNRDHPPPLKFFKPNPTRSPELKSREESDPISSFLGRAGGAISFLPLRPDNPVVLQRDFSPQSEISPQGSPHGNTGAVTSQDCPIDLSVKSKSPSPSQYDLSDEHHISTSSPGDVDNSEESDEDVDVDVSVKKKIEQESPLDLSAARTG
ncbi:unnamed protein product, partial [Meganyctiphanes norvegica]